MKLKCIKSYDNTGVPTNLIVGKLYDLQEEDEKFYYLTEDEVGNKRAGYYKDKFVKVKDCEEKHNMKRIRCINVSGLDPDDQLVLDKIYQVHNESSEFYHISPNDPGFFKGRFEVVPSRDEELTNRTCKIIEQGGLILLRRRANNPRVNVTEWYIHQHTNIAAGIDEMKLGRRPVALEMHNLKWAFAIAKLYDCKVVVYYPNGKNSRNKAM